MHYNHFFATNENDVNCFNQSRVSSMFSKKSQAYEPKYNNPLDKHRPSSVSKIFPGSTETDIMKWLPLIKMIRKIQSKVKALSMFFWCRIESLRRIQPTQFYQKNIIDNKIFTQDSTNFNTQNSSKVQEIKPLQSSSDAHQRLMPVQAQQANKEALISYSVEVIQDNAKLDKTQQQKNESAKTAQYSNFISLIQKAIGKMMKTRLKQGHLNIESYGRRKLSLEKFLKIELKYDNKRELFHVMRTIKKHSHQMMKGEILGNTLKSCIKRTEMQIFKLILKQIEIRKRPENFESSKSIKIALKLIEAKSEIDQVKVETLQKQQPTPKPIELSRGPSTKGLRIQSNKKIEVKEKAQIQLAPNLSRPLILKWNFLTEMSSPEKVPKEDKTVSKAFMNQSDHELMKKLSRLYPEEPFLQIPDISEITLFNSTIHLDSHLSEFSTIKSKELKPTQSIQNQIKNQYQSTTQNFDHNLLDLSPRFDQKYLSTDLTKPFISKNSHQSNLQKPTKQYEVETKLKQSNEETNKSSGRIIYLRNTSSSNLKNYPQTPSSTKRMTGIFSKKNSVEIFDKDPTPKNQKSKFTSYKQSNIKKSTTLSEIKLSKNHEAQRKVPDTSSIQKSSNNQPMIYSKTQQSNIEFQEIAKSQKQLSIQKKVVKSTIQVEKLHDLSAKRVGTMIKKGLRETRMKESQSAVGFNKITSQKSFGKDQSTKENKLSEFNTLGSKVISYQDFIKQCPNQFQNISGRKPLMEISDNEPIFGQIKIVQSASNPVDSDKFQESCSAQLPRERADLGEAKCKRMRAKIDKIEMNTARKMKLEIQNMINQRKKNSIGTLKY